eukprot:TRINITY_DN786_c0_g7_i1.p1 TRINITY_DN786_c0_g7~~TRINITY_DN786_c0_g7_i1.p1  ORF type:complete len:924 (-),score=135.37 TRINITY_DN786_c0_g7_i1:1405-4176(-)
MGTDSDSDPPQQHRTRSLSNKERYYGGSEASDNEDDSTYSDTVSDYIASSKSEGDIFSTRADQFPEEYQIFLKDILLEQLSIPESYYARIKSLPTAIHESFREFLWNPALKADQLVSFMTSKFSNSGTANPLRVRWLGVHPNHVELIVEAVRFVHAAFGQDHLRDAKTLRSELEKFVRLHSSAFGKFEDYHTEIILTWWFPQLVELLALLKLKNNAKTSQEDITSAFLKCYDAFEANSITTLYLLSGEYLLHPPSSFSVLNSLCSQYVIGTQSEAKPDPNEPSVEKRYQAFKEKSKKHTDALRKIISQTYSDLSPNPVKSSRSLQGLSQYSAMSESKGMNLNNIEGLLVEENFAVVLSLCKVKLMKEGGDELCKFIVQYFKFRDKLIPLLNAAISQEISETTGITTLFRGESPATKLLSAHFNDQGLDYLRHVTHHLITEIVFNNQDWEIDPSKADKGVDVMNNLEKLLVLTQDFLKTLFKSVDQCPTSFRLIFAHTQREIGNRFPEMKQLVVGAFLFLRFICPALVTPERYSILPNEGQNLPAQARRGLILVSKLLQNLANNVEFDGSKEDYTKSLNRLITRNIDSVRKFFDELADETKIGVKSTEQKSTGLMQSASSASASLTFANGPQRSGSTSRFAYQEEVNVSSKVVEYLRSNALDCILANLLEPGVADEMIDVIKTKFPESAKLRLRSFQLRQSPSTIKSLIIRHDMLSHELLILASRLGDENCRRVLGLQLKGLSSSLSRNDSELALPGSPSSLNNDNFLGQFTWESESKEIESLVQLAVKNMTDQKASIAVALREILKLHRFLEGTHKNWPAGKSKTRDRQKDFKDMLLRQVLIIAHLWYGVHNIEIPFTIPDVWECWFKFKEFMEAGIEYLFSVVSTTPSHQSIRDCLCILIVQLRWSISRVIELQQLVRPIDF